MSDWQQLPVLVTGAGGFIGSTLVEMLAQAGARVRAFVRYNSRGDPGLLRLLPEAIRQQIELVPGDLRDLPAVEQAVAGCQYVFHLGALISIPYSYRHPYEVAETNFMGTLNVLQACREHHVERLVHTSTSEVYGSARYTPMDENHPLQGQSPYSASKIGADKLAESYYRAFDLPVITIRPFNTYGPRQSARAVIPAIITQALTAEKIHLGTLETRRDFTYVTDTARGFMLAAQAQQVDGEVINLGTGQAVSIQQLAELIFRLLGKQAVIETDTQRLRPQKSEVTHLQSNRQLALEKLGWEPRVSLETGLQSTIDWIRDHLDLYRPGMYEF